MIRICAGAATSQSYHQNCRRQSHSMLEAKTLHLYNLSLLVKLLSVLRSSCYIIICGKAADFCNEAG